MEIIANGGNTMMDKIVKTCKENAFLIILFICVCIVAIGTLSVVNQDMDKDRPDNDKDLVILDDPIDINQTRIIKGERNSTLDLKTGEIFLDSDYAMLIDNDKEESDDESDYAEEVFYEGEDEEYEGEIEFIDNYVEGPSQYAAKMIAPVKGEIITEFAKDKLIYSETLQEWRGHSGIDIKAKVGTNVIAVLDGTVSKLYEDSLWGKTIVIDHGQELFTKYCNLGTLEMVKEGLQVKQGDYISTVGKTAQIESLMDEHLHFEVINKQKTVDPRSIMD